MDPEQPEADVVEQQQLVDDRDDPERDDPDHDDRADGAGRGSATADVFADPDGFPAEADPADVAEQRAIVPQDIDEP